MKRTVSVRDAVEGEPADGPEQKRVKEEDEDVDAVLELSVDDFECVICCGESILGHRCYCSDAPAVHRAALTLFITQENVFLTY
jgi:hypothetical protein